jgi:ribosomal protein S18 acetylase RimI-like enzyme
VARERIFLARVQAPPIESTREFVLKNIQNNYPQYVAVKDERVVGWCDIIPKRGIDFSHSEVMGMGIHKNYRNHGIGTALLETTIDAGKRYGLERIELEVYMSNMTAIKLYEKHGFIAEGVKKKARKLDNIYFDIQTMALIFNR